MKLNGWVESYVINVFCRKLFRDNHPRKSNKHFFFSTTSDYLLEKWKNEDTRVRWKENVINGLVVANGARELHLSERLYFPSAYSRHWFVFAVDLKARNFLFLDSINGKECNYSKKTSNLLIKNFKEVWFESGLKNMRFENFQTVYPVVPKQDNGDDCGIFTIKYMESYCPRIQLHADSHSRTSHIYASSLQMNYNSPHIMKSMNLC
uniref:Uncharacterized protein n=1 Tax=Avena sativa TaxID=4498 RepID=A0ACD5VBH6_AVESA